MRNRTISEGHIGMDGRYYMLDLARSFPPESIAATEHLSDLHEDGTSVLVFIPSCTFAGKEVPSKVLMGTVYKAYINGKYYDVLLETGKVLFKHPSEYIKARTLSIFWRLLRPEYVIHRGNRSAAVEKAASTDGLEGLALVQILANSVAREVVSKVANFFDVVAPALLEMSGVIDLATSRTSVVKSQTPQSAIAAVRISADASYDAFQTDSAASIESNIADAVYDNFVANANCGGNLKHELTPKVHDLGYDEFITVKVGAKLENFVNETADGSESIVGSYGAYDDFEAVSTTGIKLKPDILWHPDAIVDAEGPLSPDAGSAFSRADPYAVARNEEVRLATIKLLDKIIPVAADELCKMPLATLQDLDLVDFCHSRGINMRHLGYLRSCIPATKANFGCRLKIFVEIISRTLKNLLRDFQRRWMRSEKSTSEEGMLNLITQFLNLIVGSNLNSDEFWQERVVIGMIQRFGRCIWFYTESDNSLKKSLSEVEILSDIHYLRQSSYFLHSLLPRFLNMMGLVIDSGTLTMFLSDSNPYRFEFMPADINEYEPRVKCMHIVNFGIGAALQFEAENRQTKDNSDPRIIGRMIKASKKHYEQAQSSLPADAETKNRLKAVSDMMLTYPSSQTLDGGVKSDAHRAAASLAPMMKTGTLKKDGGGFFSSWTTRHFVLLHGKLSYYEKSSVNPPYGLSEKGSTNLVHFKISQVPYVAQYRMKLEHSKDSKSRSFLIEANSQNELDEWMEAINAHIKYVNEISD